MTKTCQGCGAQNWNISVAKCPCEEAVAAKELAVIEAAKAYRELKRSFADATTRAARADIIGVIDDVERQLLDAIDALEA